MDRKIVLPGEKLADGKVNLANTYSDETGTYATLVGFTDETGKYIPIEKRYKPEIGETIVGIVTDMRHAGYSVDLNMPEEGFISTKFMRVELQLGDFIIARIRVIERYGSVDLTEVRRLPRGKMVEFPSAKIPRLVGKQSSMLETLKHYGGGDILVGNNGYVWISEAANIPLIMKAMEMIEEKAHKHGLTDAVTEFFEKQQKR